MKAVQLVAPQRFEFVEIPEPTPKPGEVLVRMEYLAVCGSDLKFYDRTLAPADYPLAVGRPCHECVAVVEESGGSALKAGQRAIVLTNQGGLMHYQAVPPHLVIPVPEKDMDPAMWVFCQPMGTVFYALKRLGSVLGQRVVVVGQGPIGLSFTDLMVRLGAKQVIATDVHDYRLETSRKLGATATINARRENVLERVKDLTGGAMADIAVEACGLPDTYHQVFDVIRRLGTVVIFGVPHLEDTFAFDWGMAYGKLPNIIVTNSMRAGEREGSVADCVDLVAQGRMDLSYLLTHRFSWADIPQAYLMYSRNKEGCLKGIIEV
ncbi:MAG TPA: zinc-binding dehydrogenase [Chloroflexota bacterium]|nr:zinc-binding dehydrogenase [Chloroflexota bacterium]